MRTQAHLRLLAHRQHTGLVTDIAGIATNRPEQQMATHLRYAFALAACTALVAPPTRIQRCTARRATAEAAEAAKIITDNLEAFSQAATATDAGLAMARIYDAIPKDDLSLDAVNPETGFLGQAERLDVFRELASRRDESGLWTQDNVESFKALRAALDPLHVTDLKGYLSFAGLFGGGLYIARVVGVCSILRCCSEIGFSARDRAAVPCGLFSAPVLFASAAFAAAKQLV